MPLPTPKKETGEEVKRRMVTSYIFVPFIVELRSVQFLLLNEYAMLCYGKT